MTRLKRRISLVALLVTIVLMTIAVPVSAAIAYRASIAVVESNGTAYTMLPVMTSIDNTFLATNGFITASALDTRVGTLGGQYKPWLVADDKTLFATAIPADSQTNLYLTTGNTAATSMDIITGYNGYVTMTDDPDLELGNDFEIEIDGYIDTTAASVGENIILKANAFRTYISAATDVTASIFNWLVPSADNAEGTWVTPANTHDNNVATQGNVSPPAGGWSNFLEISNAAAVTSSVRAYLLASAPAQIDLVDIDVFYAAAWHDVYSGAFAGGVWIEYALGGYYSVTNSRVRFHDNAGGAQIGYVYELQWGSWVTSVTASGITSGDYLLEVIADGVDMKIYVDSVEEDTIALGAVTVLDNANNWVLMSNATPYFDWYKHSVDAGGGLTLIAWYQPITIISGTTLPDRQGAAENGVFTWGANPAGIAVTNGSLVSTSQSVPGTVTDRPTKDVTGEAGGSDWNAEPDVAGALLTHPLRPLITVVSDNTTLTESQVWLWSGICFVFLVLMLSIRYLSSHKLMVGIALAVAIIALVVQSVFPVWAVAVAVLAIAAGIIAERSQSI